MDLSHFLYSFWWLIFPLAWFIGSAWQSWMRFRRHQTEMDVLKSYAAKGEEPPASVLAVLKESSAANEQAEHHQGYGKDGGRGATVFLVFLMAGLAAIFAYAGYKGMMGLGEEAYFIAMILGVVGLAFLASGLFGGKRD